MEITSYPPLPPHSLLTRPAPLSHLYSSFPPLVTHHIYMTCVRYGDSLKVTASVSDIASIFDASFHWYFSLPPLLVVLFILTICKVPPCTNRTQGHSCSMCYSLTFLMVLTFYYLFFCSFYSQELQSRMKLRMMFIW